MEPHEGGCGNGPGCSELPSATKATCRFKIRTSECFVDVRFPTHVTSERRFTKNAQQVRYCINLPCKVHREMRSDGILLFRKMIECVFYQEKELLLLILEMPKKKLEYRKLFSRESVNQLRMHTSIAQFTPEHSRKGIHPLSNVHPEDWRKTTLRRIKRPGMPQPSPWLDSFRTLFYAHVRYQNV